MSDAKCPLNRSSRRLENGFSLIELLVVVAVILVIVAIAIPNFLRARMAANGAAAAETVRTITTASVVYSTTWANGFPPSLDALGGAVPATCNGAVLIDPVVGSPPYQKSGYQYAFSPQGPAVPGPPPGCVPGYGAYLVSGTPVSVYTGVDSYCSDEPGVLHYDPTGAGIATPAACEALPQLQ